MRLLVLLAACMFARAAHAAAPEICEKAHRHGWRATEDGRIFPSWYLQPTPRLDLGAVEGLERFLDALTERGVTPVVVLIPPPPLAAPEAAATVDTEGLDWSLASATAGYHAMARWLESRGAVTVPVLEAALDPALDRGFFFMRDHHWTPAGSRAAARLVASTLRADPRWATQPHRTFATSKIQDATLAGGGSAAHGLKTRCGTTFPDVTLPVYRSKPTSPRQVGLLDDAPAYPVVLLGTSYSMMKFGFPGFLREFAELEVLEVPVNGGRVMGAPLTYFTSRDYADSPPVWVVWEMAVVAEALPDNGVVPAMADPDVYRELVPAVHGRCAAPVMSGSAPLGPGDNLVFAAGAAAPPAAGHYLVLETTDGTPGPLTVVTHFADGTDDRFAFGRYSRVESRESFFLEPPRHQSAGIESVFVEATDAASGEVRYQLCAY